MKKLFLLFTLCYAFTLKAQYYNFSVSTGTYTNLTGATMIDNTAWFTLNQPFKVPFTFKFWGLDISDSVYVNNLGSIGLTDTTNEILFIGDLLVSRGAGKSPVSYKVEGTSPSRIFKLEMKNVGFFGDFGGQGDSANAQCWIYETSNIIEFKYGPSKVQASSFLFGPIAGLSNSSASKVILLQKDPANPTVKKDTSGFAPLNALPVSGTTYRFTPAQFPTGINHVVVKMNVISNKIVLPASLEVRAVSVHNNCGQLVRSAKDANDIELSNLAPGLYLITIQTKDGFITQKLIL